MKMNSVPNSRLLGVENVMFKSVVFTLVNDTEESAGL